MKNASEKRIVSLVPSLTECLCHFGLQKNIVGCTSFCVEPKSLRHSVPSVGGTKDARIEDIVALKPTHIVVNSEENTRELISTLRTLENTYNFQLIETFLDKPTDNFDLIRDLGQTFEFEEQANNWIRDQKEKLQELCGSVDRDKRFRFSYFIWMNPWMVAGNSTYISRTLELIGGVNAIETSRDPRERYPVVIPSDSRILDADILLFSSEPFPFKERHIAEFRQQSHFSRPMIKVDGQALSWYGSRFAETLKYLGRLHANIQKEIY